MAMKNEIRITRAQDQLKAVINCRENGLVDLKRPISILLLAD